jgi:hypothetical protein
VCVMSNGSDKADGYLGRENVNVYEEEADGYLGGENVNVFMRKKEQTSWEKQPNLCWIARPLYHTGRVINNMHT